jgi:protocatechuate 3,4-dioxygenase beta subunit
MKHHEHDHDRGLSHDLQTMRAALTTRRGVLRLLAGASLLPLVGCLASGTGGEDGEDQDSGSGSNGGGADAGTDESCAAIPAETAGPYPGDGSNGANALLLAGIARSDIRASVATASGTAQGVLLTVKLTLVDSEASCAPLSGYAVYLWHCDRDGAYSMYAGSALNENYLRGVQETDADGVVTFTTIFPGCYAGRWPHMHFEIYPSLASATNASSKLHTSQLALPQAACDEVYATSGYSASVANLGSITLQSDNVFSDGVSSQLASVTGGASDGYVATLRVAVAG